MAMLVIALQRTKCKSPAGGGIALAIKESYTSTHECMTAGKDSSPVVNAPSKQLYMHAQGCVQWRRTKVVQLLQKRGHTHQASSCSSMSRFSRTVATALMALRSSTSATRAA